ncbi:MAG TPA: RraA family protein [Crenotrichaceae bacterium]|nr:RraA family protein [Crenotrichaceae bacterium]
MWTTANLCDRYSTSSRLQIASPDFKSYGKKSSFYGQISTIKVFEDNVIVRQALKETVNNRILVLDGGGSKRCALLGDNIASIASVNQWQGIIVNGCVRDSEQLVKIPIGIMALGVHPLKSNKNGHGERDIPVCFSGIIFNHDDYLYADADGIVVSKQNLIRIP